MFHRLISPLKEGRSPVSIQGAKGSFKAFFISQIEKEIEGPIVVVTSSPIEAERIFNDLKCFMGKGEYPLLGPDRGIHLLPPWDTLPFEKTSPYILIQAKRMETLFSIIASKVPPIIILPIRSLMQRVVPRSHLRDVTITISPGKRISPEEISQRLMNGGFISSPICEERGDFSSRGGILDCFPPLYEFPIRMEFFGDQIDSVRHFDPRTQRSLDPVSEAVIIPVREIPWDQESRKLALSRILDTKLNGKGEDILVLLERIEEGIGFPGIEYMLPFFHHHLETVFDYMRGMPIFVIDGPSYVENTAYEFWNEIQSRYGNAIKDGRPFPPEEEIYIHPEEIRKRLEGLLVINFDDLEIIEGPIKEHPEPFRVLIETNEDLRREMLHQPMDEGIFRGFAERINNWITRGMEIHLFGHTWGQAQRIKDILEEYGVTIKWHEGEGFKPKGGFQDKIPCQIHTGVLSQGFRFEEGRIIVLTDEDIFGPRKPQRTRKSYREAPVITDFEDLKENDLIVHVEHGVGIFRGLSHLNVEGSYGDFLTIEYLGNDRLYVPVYKLNMVHRYIGTEGFMPKLDRLGSKAWERRKKQASESIRKMAKELLEVYAAREALQGFAFNRDDPYYHEFERAFEYEETPDQKVAIEDVLKDMERPRPMDRLICGDVGYGKTEVAMRAAFKAVMHGKQVAVLVPTTILAQQHYQTFQDRFRGYPVFIQVLSRFKNRAEQKEILKGLKNGTIDILIGTHRLLQKDIAFKDLGLIIIDEEHRFGVAHKEILKKVNRLVDVITMSATPIPRTLHMGLAGIRDLSLINTPPPNRLSIRTYISHFDRELIEEAVMREINRGGQVFFVHNRVQSIQGIARVLKKWLPGLRIAVAHGQLPSYELERVMTDYVHKKIDLLVCTTIIQSGLDIPDANTIIINQADRLGLAEMYQIRGRVGRSGHRAYAYLLIPKGKDSITEEARKRLQVLQEFSELGAGFKIAQRDLEIRGAGTILGPRQSGHIDSLGLEMYTTLMKQAVSELKGEPIKKEIEPEIHIPEPAYLPETFIQDTHQRLFFYKKLSLVRKEEELIEAREELEDRFGKAPVEAVNLLEVIMIKILLRKMGIQSLRWQDGWIDLTLNDNHHVDIEAIVRIAQEERDRFRLSPEGRISFKIDHPSDNSASVVDITRALKILAQKITMAHD